MADSSFQKFACREHADACQPDGKNMEDFGTSRLSHLMMVTDTWTMKTLLSALGLLLVANHIPTIFGQESCPGGVHLNPTGSDLNGCSYGGCLARDGTGTRRCVHDSTFCRSTEDFVPAEDLIEMNLECTCEDILDYPSTIGICDHSGGVYTAMVNLTTDCPPGDGVPLCSPDEDGRYTVGNPQVAALTACDLPCNKVHGHTRPTTEGEYEGCQFPRIDWAVANTEKTGYYWPRDAHVLDDLLIIVGDARSIDEEVTEDNFAITGPFTKGDPTGTNGKTIKRSLQYPEVSYGDNYVFGREYDFDTGIAIVDINTGEPLDFVLFGPNFHTSFAKTVFASNVNDEKVVVVGGKFTGSLQFQTDVCQEQQNIMVTTSCVDTLTEFQINSTYVDLPGIEWELLDTFGFSSWLVSLRTTDASSQWLAGIRWAVVPFTSEWSSQVEGSAIDSAGDVYASGNICRGDRAMDEVPCYGVVGKFAANNGAKILKSNSQSLRTCSILNSTTRMTYCFSLGRCSPLVTAAFLESIAQILRAIAL